MKTKTPPTDRRRNPRHAVGNVSGTLHISAGAKILNMSVTGMAVETSTQLRVGRSYSLTLRHADDFVLRLNGTVIWCHLRGIRKAGAGDTTSVYHAGFKFDDGLAEKVDELTRFLEATAVITLDTRISGRFKLKLTEPVDLDTDFRFVVKTISASGVLIEADTPLPTGTVFTMEIHLQGAVLRTKGRVVHVREAAEGEPARSAQMGVEFVETAPTDRRAIEEFIARQLQ
jgi:hypothetical protein